MSLAISEVVSKVKLEEVKNEIIGIARYVELRGGSEEDLKVRVEHVLKEKVWRELGVPEPEYERVIKGVGGLSVRHYRVDALYGLTLFEYKKPNTLRRHESREEAVGKVKSEYIPGLLEDREIKRVIDEIRGSGLPPRVAGVIMDGYNVVFVDCYVDRGACTVDPEVGAYPLDEWSLRRIVRVVIASYKKRLDARSLASDFGYRSVIARKAVRTFYNILLNPGSERTKVLFEEWRRAVSQAYPLSPSELAKIAEQYGFSEDEVRDVQGDKLFYAIQTYYAFILKLLAAEVSARFYNASAATYIKHLLRARDYEDLRRELELLETGTVYRWFGIRNFLEGEMFGWYLDEWSSEVAGIVREIIEVLSEYDVEAITLDLQSARDMFKLLYEELVPREEVRRYLGIYTTPDWLAELILDELGLSASGFKDMESKGLDPLNVKVLDPGAGTGTFLSLVIQRLATYLKERYPGRMPGDVARRALKAITRNIVGFDIDALAILTAKTNYLLALASAELLAYKGGEVIEIPVYMANSMVTAENLEDRVIEVVDSKTVTVEVIKIPTVKGDFILPLKLVKSGRLNEFLLNIMVLLEGRKLAEDPEVKRTLRAYSEVCGDHEREACFKILERFYGKLYELKVSGVDTLWIPIIRSHISPTMFEGVFDYVVGNPPWIAFRYIADPVYQGKVKDLIVNVYGLVLDAHLMTHMEMATLFLVRSMDLYLKDGGLVGFVMPRAVFSGDQHDVFRRCAVKRVDYRLLKVIDCEGVEPLFYVPACAVIARKDGRTSYPVDALIVRGRLPVGEHKTIPLDRARGYLKFEAGKLYLNKLGSRTWLDYREFRLQAGRSYYYGFFDQGATIVPQSSWLVDVVEQRGDLVVVKSSGRIGVRGKVKREIPVSPIEKKFIYGVLTSAEVMPFCHLRPSMAVLPIIPRGGRYSVISREQAKQLGYRHLAEWLERAEREWSEIRGAKREKLTLYQWLDYRRKLSMQSPGARFKVVYLTSGAHLASTLVDVERVRESSPLLNNVVIDSTLYHYETDDEDEAYYLVAVLNSNVLDELIKPMQSKGEFGERDIHKKPLEYPIPRYNPHNPVHEKLSKLGREASEKASTALPEILKEYGYDRKLEERGVLTPHEVGTVRKRIKSRLKDIIDQIDSLVLKLFEGEAMSKTTLNSFLKT